MACLSEFPAVLFRRVMPGGFRRWLVLLQSAVRRAPQDRSTLDPPIPPHVASRAMTWPSTIITRRPVSAGLGRDLNFASSGMPVQRWRSPASGSVVFILSGKPQVGVHRTSGGGSTNFAFISQLPAIGSANA